MTRGPSRFQGLGRILRPVLVAVLALTLIAVTILGLRIRVALSEFQDQPTDNLHWNLSQLELDLVRLREEIHVVALDPNEPIAELRKRFDLFYSRAQNAIGGKGYTSPGLETISAEMSNLLKTYLDATTPVIDVPDDQLRQRLPDLRSAADALREDLRRTSINMIQGLADQSDERRRDFAVLVHEMALALGLAIATLLALLGLVVWLNREASNEARRTARISARLAATVNTALDAVIVADEFGRIIEYNPSAAKIFGFPRHAAIGRDVAALIIPQRYRAAHAAGIARARQNEAHKFVNAGRFQTTALNQNGEEFPVEMSISEAMSNDKAIFVAFIRDITDRLAAETQLRSARDEALAAERAKTSFIAVMSHEMRTPLNGVLASLEIAAGKAADPDQSRFIGLAQDSANQILRLANDVLDITRLETGQLRLSEEDFDPGAHLTGLVEAIRPLCAARNLTLDITLLGELPRLRGDSFRLGQIVQNFLSNAIKFVERGGITVEAEVADTLGDDRTIEIRVIDTGPGIPEADQARIFDEFVMLDPSFQRLGGGAGLGLAISRQLAEAIGGQIGVESAPGDGSCFWLRVTLPLAAAGEVAPGNDQPGARLARRKILVVEDNTTNRAVLEEMLRHLGQSVVMANDGQAGSDEARARRYDLILMDVSMPVMDGLAATRIIRSGGASHESRIVAVTAHSMPTDRERFHAAGMDDVLVKPVSLAALTRILAGEAIEAAGPDGCGFLDPERLRDLQEALGRDGFQRILTQFGSDGEALNAQVIAGAADLSPPEVMVALCHEAAGLASVIGAERLRRHYALAQSLYRKGDADGARSMLSRDTDRLWRQTMAAVRRYREDGGRNGASLSVPASEGPG